MNSSIIDFRKVYQLQDKFLLFWKTLDLPMYYSFSWTEVFYIAKQKAVINEIDVARRLQEFPVEWLEHVQWVILPFKGFAVGESIRRIADDFLFGRENSLGVDKVPIYEAMPGINKK